MLQMIAMTNSTTMRCTPMSASLCLKVRMECQYGLRIQAVFYYFFPSMPLLPPNSLTDTVS